MINDGISLTYWGRHRMAVIFQTTLTFSNRFSSMKMYEFSLKFHWRFLLRDPINNIPALVQTMAWRRSGDKPLSEPIMVIWRICAPLDLNDLITVTTTNFISISLWKSNKYICRFLGCCFYFWWIHATVIFTPCTEASPNMYGLFGTQ